MLPVKPLSGRTTAVVPRMGTMLGWLPEEFTTLWDRFFTDWPVMQRADYTERYPLTIEELEKEFVVRAELPGFAPEEVKAELNGETLMVEAEHKEPEGEKKEEKTYAQVQRVITLPPDVEVEKVGATYRHGVLELHLPKKAEAVPRKIGIEVKS